MIKARPTPSLEATAKAIRQGIYNEWSAALIGSVAGNVVATQHYERMKYPCPGDWVAEISTIYSGTHLRAVGVFEGMEREPVEYSEGFVWDEVAEGRPHPTEPFWYIRCLDGTQMRWYNCTIIAAYPGLRK